MWHQMRVIFSTDCAERGANFSHEQGLSISEFVTTCGQIKHIYGGEVDNLGNKTLPRIQANPEYAAYRSSLSESCHMCRLCT